MEKRHRNIEKRRLCETCDHSHFASADPTTLGVCLQGPPTPILVGMGSPSVVQKPDFTNVVPIVRGFYPPILRTDSCAMWTVDCKGEA
jgi:hypothetical protein